MERKKIIIVTQYFPPEVGGGANRSVGFAEELAALGNDVTVLAPFPSYFIRQEHARIRFRLFEMRRESNYVVYRTFVIPTSRRSFAKRAVYYLSFILSALLVLLLKIKKADYAIAISPPLFTGIIGVVAKHLRSCKFILDIGDLWADAGIQLKLLHAARSIRLAKRFEQWIYRSADSINLVTPGTCERFLRDTSLNTRVALVPNFVDTTFIRKFERPANLSRHLGLAGNMIFGYAGNIGRAQGIQTIVRAAELTQHVEKILFLIIGDGVERPEVEGLIREHNVKNVMLLPPVSREEIPLYISLMDVMIVPLVNAELFRHTIPSKLYESMAAEIPVILCVDGEARQLVEDSRCGVFVKPEDPVQLAEAVLDFYYHPELIEELGSNGRAVVEEHFAIEKVVRRFWDEVNSPDRGSAQLPPLTQSLPCAERGRKSITLPPLSTQ